MLEIERKFLVKSNTYKELAKEQFEIIQGFLNSHPERTVRVRVTNNQAFLTIKGKSDNNGLTRFEWEKQIPKQEALQLLKLCEPGVIKKNRFLVPVNNYTFEVDEFYDDNEGLVIAEIELQSENEHFPKPDWLGEEVTGNVKYYNSQLSKHPFKKW